MIFVIFILFLKCMEIFSTIDITLAEYNYLANHLHPEECRKLIAALYFNSYNKPNSLDEAERRVPEDIPCLRQLLHWNRDKGVGETHEVVMRSLHHIDRSDLADWLGKTVFKELGQELEQDLNAPFDKFLIKSTIQSNIVQPTYPSRKSSSYDWTKFDSICIIFIALIGVGTILMLLMVILEDYIKKKTSHRKNSKENSKCEYSIISDDRSDSDASTGH